MGFLLLCILECKPKDEKYMSYMRNESFLNKLAKARKMRKPPGTLGLKKFRPGKFGVEKIWAQHIEKVEDKLRKLDQKSFWVKK